jgi:hypothetical protein
MEARLAKRRGGGDDLRQLFHCQNLSPTDDSRESSLVSLHWLAGTRSVVGASFECSLAVPSPECQPLLTVFSKI